MEDTSVEVPAKFKDLVEGIEKMSVMELNELVKLLVILRAINSEAHEIFEIEAPGIINLFVEIPDGFVLGHVMAGINDAEICLEAANLNFLFQRAPLTQVASDRSGRAQR